MTSLAENKLKRLCSNSAFMLMQIDERVQNASEFVLKNSLISCFFGENHEIYLSEARKA